MFREREPTPIESRGEGEEAKGGGEKQDITLDPETGVIEISPEMKALREDFSHREAEALKVEEAEDEEGTKTGKALKAITTGGLLLLIAASIHTCVNLPRQDVETLKRLNVRPEQQVVQAAEEKEEELSLVQKKELASEILKKISQIPEQPTAESKMQNWFMQKQVARSLIYDLAEQLCKGQDFYYRLNRDVNRDAVDLLEENIPAFVEQEFGDLGEEGAQEKLNELSKLPGFEVLQEWIEQPVTKYHDERYGQQL